MALLRFSYTVFSIFSLLLHASVAHNDPIKQTMEDFSGYPPIKEPLVSNSIEAQQKQIRTVEINKVSSWASTRSIIMFFSYCGDIESVEMQSKYKHSQKAFVTFKHSFGADCAIQLSGTKLIDLTVTITLASSPELPHLAAEEKATVDAESSLFKTKDLFSSILAKGHVLGKAFADGTYAVNEKVQQADQTLQVSETVKSAIAKSAVVKNQYVSIGASWATGAFSSIAKYAAEVKRNADEKVAIAEEEKRRHI